MTVTAPAGARPRSRVAAARRRPGAWRLSDSIELAAAAASSYVLTWLIFGRLMPFTVQPAGFAICWYALFLGAYWGVARDSSGPVVARDRIMAVLISTGAGLALAPLLLVIGYVVYRGLSSLRPGFLLETMQLTGPLQPATEGGGMHSILGTIEQVGIAALISVPLGILTAVYLNEVKGPIAAPARLVASAMTALPSVVAGLFVYALLIVRLRWGFSGFAGSLALAILMLPTVTIAAEQVLRIVPGSLREAALALGGPEWRAVALVVLPTARTGLITAVILGTARIIGETAPMMLTAVGTKILNPNPFGGIQDDLPLFVYHQIRAPQDTSVDRAWAGSLVLLILVLLLFLLARAGGQGGRRSGKGTRR
ncbi:phosphate ABC transporter, permease protein PstA [Spongiactinospora gelatinilytica]|uniref:Phosphate transport system permease protein PstA n=1 Tax=Spongiactinospora gelatinilytica TaxID=2666298 RepID=A0A2W2I594_9ACTN|nr:phosphate ABC transporter permease PstA [Spongiactinospora gelatinilytica]PZG45694.1 phosphate ABC transporter, permease protein PstA [Spongiactinospora gelatinilytica]